MRMHEFWNCIDSIYCINLIEREDRYQHAIKEFTKIGIIDKVVFHRVSRHPRGGIVGNCTSIQQVFRMTSNETKPILIFEDDVFFDEERLENLKLLVKYLQSDCVENWDTIRLGSWKALYDRELQKDAVYMGNAQGLHATIFAPHVVKHIMGLDVDNSEPILVDRYIASKYRNNIILKYSVCFQDELGTDALWPSKEQQSLFLQSPILFQKEYEKKSINAWNIFGNIPNKFVWLRRKLMYAYVLGIRQTLCASRPKYAM